MSKSLLAYAKWKEPLELENIVIWKNNCKLIFDDNSNCPLACQMEFIYQAQLFHPTVETFVI